MNRLPYAHLTPQWRLSDHDTPAFTRVDLPQGSRDGDQCTDGTDLYSAADQPGDDAAFARMLRIGQSIQRLGAILLVLLLACWLIGRLCALFPVMEGVFVGWGIAALTFGCVWAVVLGRRA